MGLLGLSEILASVVADQTVAVSKNSRLGMPWVKTVIPNGIDLDRFRPRGANRFSVDSVRRERTDAESGAVSSRMPSSVTSYRSFRIVSCGWCAKMHRARPGVKSMGRISDDELSDLYGRAWVFCLPSTYEGFGIPYIEAMASGCPVVATENPGVMEVTSNGQLGVIVDDDHLGEALVDLLSSPEQRAHLADRWIGGERVNMKSSPCVADTRTSIRV